MQKYYNEIMNMETSELNLIIAEKTDLLNLIVSLVF